MSRARFLFVSSDLILTRAANLSGYLKSSLRLTDLTNASWMHAPSSGRITRTASETYSRQGAGLLMSSQGILGWFFLPARCTCVHVRCILRIRAREADVPLRACMYMCARVYVNAYLRVSRPVGVSAAFLFLPCPSSAKTGCVHIVYARTNDFWSKAGINKYV